MLVVDSSALAGALLSHIGEGAWARESLQGHVLLAPVHVHVEVSNVLRRLVLQARLTAQIAALVHRDLLDVDLRTFGFSVVADRVWQLHPNVTAYDAACVALAEAVEVPLLTLDRRLARADGPTCDFLLPPE